MNPRTIATLIAKMGALPYFPADDDARIAIAEIFAKMAHNVDEVRWTVDRCLQIWDKWEGPHELRSVFCTKYKPVDGVDAVSRLPQFADGIPSESEDRNHELLGGGEQKRLEPGAAIQLVQDARSFDAAGRPRDAVDEISDRMDRDRTVKRATLPDDEEIERIKAEQDARRVGEQAEFDLTQKLRGIL